jgi:hypothetical protein
MIKYNIYKNKNIKFLSVMVKSKVKLAKRVLAVASSFCGVFPGLHSFSFIFYDAGVPWDYYMLGFRV